MSGTELAYGAARSTKCYLRPTRLSARSAIGLRACYAMTGTGMRYDHICPYTRYVKPCTSDPTYLYARAVQCPVLKALYRMVLRNAWDLAYGPTKRLVLSSGMVLPGADGGTVLTATKLPRQPQISVRDAGGNLLPSVNEGAIALCACYGMPSSKLLYDPMPYQGRLPAYWRRWLVLFPPIVLRVRYALSGTNVVYEPSTLRRRYAMSGPDLGVSDHRAMSVPLCYCATHLLCNVRFATRCPVLTYRMQLSVDVRARRCPVLTYSMLLSAYARARRCPVLTLSYAAISVRSCCAMSGTDIPYWCCRPTRALGDVRY
eukprot:3941399-Rhodomonas_salina.5